MISYDRSTGRRIGTIGNFVLAYACRAHDGRDPYKLELPLYAFDEPLRLKELPELGSDASLTEAQGQHPVIQIFREVFPDAPLRWLGRYDWTYIVELPENATDAQIDKYMRRLQEEADRNHPAPLHVPLPPARSWWKRIFRFA